MELLHEVAAQYQGFCAQLEDMLSAAKDGEMDEGAIWDTLEAISGEVDQKADALATVYKTIIAKAFGIADEVKRMQERKNRLEQEAERILEYMGFVLEACGKRKIETHCNVISIRNAQRVHIEDEAYFVGWAKEYNPELLRYKEPEINKTEVARCLKSGATMDGVRMETVAHVNIK